ncbi:hypothetical protein Y032_0372g159 [Ancylostoma ceylanicum]|uniref:Uncharacterized protein n=1 Tax=Ancylostoma ceylanicum TaxID=53326 RepID=A0A016RU68_9BILA|nr:hypothetical protein Y032_0372g159 [Ancylostoma ceylanicum]
MKSNAWRIPHDGIDQRRPLHPSSSLLLTQLAKNIHYIYLFNTSGSDIACFLHCDGSVLFVGAARLSRSPLLSGFEHFVLQNFHQLATLACAAFQVETKSKS